MIVLYLFCNVITLTAITTCRYTKLNLPVARQPHGTWHRSPWERTCRSQRCHRTVIHEEQDNKSK